MVRIFALEFGWGSALWWWLGSSLVDLFEWLGLLEVVGIYPDSWWLGSWLVTIFINYFLTFFALNVVLPACLFSGLCSRSKSFLQGVHPMPGFSIGLKYREKEGQRESQRERQRERTREGEPEKEPERAREREPERGGEIFWSEQIFHSLNQVKGCQNELTERGIHKHDGETNIE